MYRRKYEGVNNCCRKTRRKYEGVNNCCRKTPAPDNTLRTERIY
jgi:hypothetical protein